MKTKKNFSEALRLITALTSGTGVVLIVVAMMVNIFIFNYSNQILDSISVIGALIFMLPFFMLQFAMPSGLLDRFRFQTNIPFWCEAMFYFMVFPFINMWMIAAADAMFHFLPNYHEAMVQGFSREIVQTMRHENAIQAWTIISITYGSLLFLGLITRGISKKIKLT